MWLGKNITGYSDKLLEVMQRVKKTFPVIKYLRKIFFLPVSIILKM